MKRFKSLLNAAALILALVFSASISAQDAVESVQHGPGFVDADGNGFNDKAPDADGDGIPNGQDPDYSRTGGGFRMRGGFVDEDGDGINDNALQGGRQAGNHEASGDHPQDGTGYKHGFGRRNGSGNPAGSCTGDCSGQSTRGLGRGGK